nr:transcription factor bye1-like [Aedes albopictus]
MQDPPKNCKKCTRPDEAENMVGCDGCDAWEHYGCAGVSDSIAGSSRSWMCEDCRRRALATTGASSTVSAYTSASSKKSRQAQLRLELLEQQKLVRIKRLEEEERYLKDKFEILMQLEEEDEIASNRSRVSTSSKRDRLQKWLEQAETVVPEGDIDAERGAVRKNVGFEASQASASGRTLTAPAFETQLVSGKLE